MGEEVGSPGLREVCGEHRPALAADVFIASDGPRLSADRPTLFLGSRGCANFDLWIDARKGGHHSGNWGGLLSSPAIQLVHALSTITDARGRIRVPEWRAAAAVRIRCGMHWRHATCEPACRAIPRSIPIGVSLGLRRRRKSSAGALRGAGIRPRATRKARSTRFRRAPGRRCQMRFVVGVDPERLRPGAAPASRCARFSDGADRAFGDEVISRDPARPRSSLGAWTAASIAAHDGQGAGHSAEPRWLTAERHLLRDPRTADRVGAALLSRLLAARAERAPARADIAREALRLMAGITGIWANQGRPDSGHLGASSPRGSVVGRRGSFYAGARAVAGGAGAYSSRTGVNTSRLRTGSSPMTSPQCMTLPGICNSPPGPSSTASSPT